MKNSKSDIIDTERVYCTTAIVKSVGRAVAISLEDATLPGTARNKHMTILYRKNMRWNANEIEGVSRETDRWIREKYGHNKAPVTFTLQPWGPKSCHIAGDLFDLCKHLRSKFAALSRDDQRPPHVALFTGNGRGKGGPKTCRICGASDHLKRHCPQKPNGKKKPNRKHQNKNNNLKDRLEGMITNIDDLKARKQKEIELLNEEQECLKQLLQSDMPPKALRKEIQKIGKLYRQKRKQLFKGKAPRKPRKHKGNKKDRMAAKQERNERKTQRRLAKEERKRGRQERVKQLDAARVVSLPVDRKEIGGHSTLCVHVDGYNIIGCDALCRKAMRGRGKGRKQARQRLVTLVQKQFLDAIAALNPAYAVEVNVWFDGNGEGMKCDGVSVVYSTRKQSVDDMLVEMLSKSGKDNNANVLVITSDKALTLRLYEIGVKVMKSGVFYKTFLAQKEDDGDVVMNTEDMALDEEDVKEIESDDDFVNVITSKMDIDSMANPRDDEDTTDSSDQVEGGRGSNDDESDEFDAEYTTIYGGRFFDNCPDVE
eukprot:178668_1